MIIFSYLTLQAPVQGVFKEKGSKFLVFAYPITTEGEAKDQLKALKKNYFDARHHGYTYRLGPGGEKHRAFDDGEPGHSTGDPILGQIRSRNLTNVLVVVVRYFGGIKLGVGGLINAYKSATEDALDKAVIIEVEVKEKFEVAYDYGATPDVMRLIKEFDLIVLEQNFNEGCNIVLESKLRQHKVLFDKMNLLKALGTKMEVTSD